MLAGALSEVRGRRRRGLVAWMHDAEEPDGCLTLIRHGVAVGEIAYGFVKGPCLGMGW